MDEPGLLDRPDTAPFLTSFLRWWAQRLPASSRTPYPRFAATARESARKLIAAATSVAARIIGAGQEIGTIEPGKLADPNEQITATFRWRDQNGNRDYDPGEVNWDPNGPDFIGGSGVAAIGSFGGGVNQVPNPNEREPKTDEFSLKHCAAGTSS